MTTGRHTHTLIGVLLFVLFVSTLTLTSIYAAPRKLSIPEPNGDNINGYEITSDGAHVVYLTDHETAERPELYRVSTTEGTPIKLNPELAPEGRVNSFRLSPNGATVVYVADLDGDSNDEFYTVPLTGGASTNLNLPPDQDVSTFRISSDNNTIVYTSFDFSTRASEIYSLPITGGTPTKLNGPLANGGSVTSFFSISPDSSTVVYVADQDTDEVQELYAVPIGGGAVTKLNGSLIDGGNVANSFTISPNSNTVVYMADQDTNDLRELYSVPITGGPPTKLNSELVDDVLLHDISSDGSTVVYTASTSTSIVDLYKAPITGGTVSRLTQGFIRFRGVSDFEISSDSTFVVYSADRVEGGFNQLFWVSLVDDTSFDFGVPRERFSDEILDFTLSPDDASVIYSFGDPRVSQRVLFQIPVEINPVERFLSESLQDVDSFAVSNDSASVVYVANRDLDFTEEIYVATIPVIGFVTDSMRIAEDAGETTITVELDAPTDQPVSVDYAVTGGTATNGEDYTLTDGTLIFPANQTTETFSISLIEDAQIEGDETIEITLRNPSYATVLEDTLTITIEDTTSGGPDSNNIYLPLLIR
ncbi:MAG: Calx-beta domain-containing protein [Chloroflexota bacterium]